MSRITMQNIAVMSVQYVHYSFDYYLDSMQKCGLKNIDLWERLLKAMNPHQVTFHWVKGHAGHPENERCDQLATAAADGEDQVSILDGLFTEQAVDVFIRRIVAVPEYAEDFQVRLGDGIEQGLFCLGQGRLAADDDDFFAEMTGNLADSIISMDANGKSRQNQSIVSLRHDKNLLK